VVLNRSIDSLTQALMEGVGAEFKAHFSSGCVYELEESWYYFDGDDSCYFVSTLADRERHKLMFGDDYA